MMDFFANMINRHLGTAEIVEPRARARFEPESRIAVDVPADNFEAEQNLAHRENRDRYATEGTSNNPQVSSFRSFDRLRIDRALREPESSSPSGITRWTPAFAGATESIRVFRDLPENSTESGFNASDKKDHYNGPTIEKQPPTGLRPTVVPSKEYRKADPPHAETLQQSIAQPRPPGAPLVQAHPPLPASTDYAAAGKKPPPGAPPLNRELDDRVETLLQRLRGPQNLQSSATRTENSERDNRSQLTESSDRDQTPKPYTPSVMPSHGGREEAGKSSKQPVRSLPQEGRKPVADKSCEPAISSIALAPRHSGVLESPAWLSQLQAEFSRRWQEMNSKSEAEPVINVTIGRVEVRAVQAEPPRQPKRKNKPTGVMSLDEYLNQRGRGGRT